MNDPSNGQSGSPWQLVADIGGTHARFARKRPGENRLLEVLGFNVAGYAQFHEALDACLDSLAGDGRWAPLPEAACFALACRVDEDAVRLTNSAWHFSRADVRHRLGDAPLALINDFAATGYGIGELSAGDWHQVGGGEAVAGKPVAVLGPGTGLGVSLVVPAGDSIVVVDGEGGHVDFAPVSDEEIEVLSVLGKRFGRVSVERLLCGTGILNIYQALAELRRQAPTLAMPEAISGAGTSGRDALAADAMALFCRVLGSVAGNLALTAGTRGGVYITGGIVPAMLDFLERSDFRRRFEAKGRFSGYLAPIPVRVVTRQDLGLLGAANRLTLDGY